MKRKAAQAASDKLQQSFSPGGRQILTSLSPVSAASETRSQRASTEAVRRQNGSKPTRASRSAERKASAASRGTAASAKKTKGSSPRKRSPSATSSSENEEEEQEEEETEEEKKSDSEDTEEIETSSKTKRVMSSKLKKGAKQKERSITPTSRKRSKSSSSEDGEQEETDSEEDAGKGQRSTKNSKAGSRTRQKTALSKSKRTGRSKSASTEEESNSEESEEDEKQKKSSPGKSKKMPASGGRKKEAAKKRSKSAEEAEDEDSDDSGVKDKKDGKAKDKKDDGKAKDKKDDGKANDKKDDGKAKDKKDVDDSSGTEEEQEVKSNDEKAKDKKGKKGASKTLTAILEKIDKVKEQAASSKSCPELSVKPDIITQTESETSAEKKPDDPVKSDSNETKPKPAKPNRELIRLGLIPSTNKRDLQRSAKSKAPPRSSTRKSQRSESNSTRTLESNSENSDEDDDDSEEDSESDSEAESKEEDDDDDECIIVDEVKPKSGSTTVVAKPTTATASADSKKTASVAILRPSSGTLQPSTSTAIVHRIQSVPGLSRTDEQLRGTTAELATRLMRLEAVIAAMKKDFAEKLAQKDKELLTVKQTSRDELVRLNNELKFKTEQLEELNKAAEKNMELEARIGFMLSGPEAYEQEVARVKEEADKAKEEEEMEDEEEGDGEDGDEEVDQDKEEGGAKKRKRSRGKKRKHEDDGPNEVDEIEQLFLGADPEPLISDIADEPVEPPEVELSVPAVSRPVPPTSTGVAALNDAMSAAARGRHEIRRLMTKLEEETKIAGKMEADRRERVKKQREKHLVTMGVNEETQQPMCERLVLEFDDEERQNAAVEVNQQLLKHLKPHQVEAVEFMWDNLVESLERMNSEEGAAGSGCILAHCMGLGKTLSVISLVHTLLKSPAVSFRSCLILAPLNAVLNWVSEWDKWVDKKQKIKVYELASRNQSTDRTQVLSDWKKTGGILVMGYQLFRILSSYSGRSRKAKQIYNTCLIDPGADIVVCDEGHVLKNDSSALSKCVNKVRTRRRIVLTGTPLQNNLIEYHCMLSFVKPNLLGSRREFCNRFVNPITNGQHADSTQADVRLMKRRAHVIHEMLAGCVQRRDYTALVKFLPPKHEYVISIHLSPLQIDLYQEYLDRFTQVSAARNLENGSSLSTIGSSAKIQSFGLFADYQVLMRIWTHPWVLKLDEIRQDKKQALTLSDDDELDDSVMYTSSSDEAVESDEVTTVDDDPDLDLDDDVVSTDGISDTKQTRRTRSSRKNGKSEKASDKSGAASADDSKKPTAQPAAAKRKRKVSSDSTSSGSGTAVEEKKDEVERLPENGASDAGELDVSASGKVRILGGEVIRPWQTRSRAKGNVPEFDFGALSMAQREEQWWDKYVKDDDKVCLEHSGKLVLLFEILAMAQQLGDKVLVFSQSLLSLDLIEDFLFMKTEEAKLHNAALSEQDTKMSVWIKDEDYVRMDGSTGAQSRRRFTANFSDASNERLRLFLISTKAGGLGINLDIANRVIIFDASWNPSHDVQSIFRVYRFGQLKPVFIYRFLAQGTMEEKIYERQVTKETLSQRVVDEHQIDRHFTAADLRELYNFKPEGLDDPNATKRPVPAVPKDVVLAELLSTPALSPWIVNYHEHDSLLENRPEENLSEEERKTAWDEYEREKLGVYEVAATGYSAGGNYLLASTAALVAQTAASAANYLPRISYPANNYGYAYNRNAWNNAVANFNNVTKVNLPAPTSYNKATQGVVTTLSEKELEAAANAAVHGIPQHLRARFGFQIQQMPKVVHEILKYNPSISAENLQKRLVAFLGMHTRTTSNVDVNSGSSSSNGSNNSRNVTVDLT